MHILCVHTPMSFRWLLLVLVSCVQPISGQSLSATARQQDLDFVTIQLPKLHPNFFFQLDPAKFQLAATTLRGTIPTATDEEFQVGIAQLVAMAGDAHTAVSFSRGLPYLPLGFVWLSDGLFVKSADAAYSKAVGTQLTAIGGIPIDDVVARLATIFPHSNDQWVHYEVQTYLSDLTALRGLHIAPQTGATAMTFRSLAG